ADVRPLRSRLFESIPERSIRRRFSERRIHVAGDVAWVNAAGTVSWDAGSGVRRRSRIALRRSSCEGRRLAMAHPPRIATDDILKRKASLTSDSGCTRSRSSARSPLQSGLRVLRSRFCAAESEGQARIGNTRRELGVLEKSNI